MESMIVIATHTVMDGLVLQWYYSEIAAVQGAEAISASRNAVMGGNGTKLTPDLFNAAWGAHERLAAGSRSKEDFADLITHTHEFGSGVLVGVVKPVSGNEATDD